MMYSNFNPNYIHQKRKRGLCHTQLINVLYLKSDEMFSLPQEQPVSVRKGIFPFYSIF